MAVVTDQKGTIVVVDDEPNIADLVDLYLAREGFRVLKTDTGEAGLRAVKDHRPRLVVLDVGLPDLDGLEVCKRLRATSQIPVIFLTARDSEVDRVLGLELGGDDYVTKPFSPAELVARVKAVLRRVDGGARGVDGRGALLAHDDGAGDVEDGRLEPGRHRQVDGEGEQAPAVEVDEGRPAPGARGLGGTDVEDAALLDELGDEVAHRHLGDPDLAGELGPGGRAEPPERLQDEGEVLAPAVGREDGRGRPDAAR